MIGPTAAPHGQDGVCVRVAPVGHQDADLADNTGDARGHPCRGAAARAPPLAACKRARRSRDEPRECGTRRPCARPRREACGEVVLRTLMGRRLKRARRADMPRCRDHPESINTPAWLAGDLESWASASAKTLANTGVESPRRRTPRVVAARRWRHSYTSHRCASYRTHTGNRAPTSSTPRLRHALDGDGRRRALALTRARRRGD